MQRDFIRAAFLACGLVAAAPAAAVNFVAVDPPVTGGRYYEQNGRATCTDISACAITFSTLPSGKLILLEHIACSVETRSSPLRSASLSVLRSSSEIADRPQALVPSPVSEDSFNGIPVYFYAIEKDTRYPLGSSSPKVTVFQTAGTDDSVISMACQISGTLSP